MRQNGGLADGWSGREVLGVGRVARRRGGEERVVPRRPLPPCAAVRERLTLLTPPHRAYSNSCDRGRVVQQNAGLADGHARLAVDRTLIALTTSLPSRLTAC